MWFALALGASVLWGLTYALHEQVYKHISVLSSLAIDAIAVLILIGGIGLYTGRLQKDVSTIIEHREIGVLLAAQILTALAAAVLIGFSINARNATVAGLIEMTYPLFIALFSYLFFRENNLSLATALGGALVFAGIATIYVFNR